MDSLPRHPRQAEVKIYTKDYCPYCHAAKNLLTQKGVGYEEIDLEHNPELARDVFAKAGRRTVPQIFVNDMPLGGFDDIRAMDQAGRLETALFPNGRGEF